MKLKSQKGLLCKIIRILKVMDISILQNTPRLLELKRKTKAVVFNRKYFMNNICLSIWKIFTSSVISTDFNHFLTIYNRPKHFRYIFFTLLYISQKLFRWLHQYYGHNCGDAVFNKGACLSTLETVTKFRF